jgi:hypothetical protein
MDKRWRDYKYTNIYNIYVRQKKCDASVYGPELRRKHVHTAVDMARAAKTRRASAMRGEHRN